MKMNIDEEIDEIIYAYNELVGKIDLQAKDREGGRAYGGIVRAGKGKLVENIAHHLTEIAWTLLGGSQFDLRIKKERIRIPLNKTYLKNLNSEVKSQILKNISDYTYPTSVDWHIYIKNRFEIGLECKSYTENAMLKRILVDFSLLKHKYPNLRCLLIQLESQLGGDYSKIFREVKIGSCSTHTLLSFFDVDLRIITILEGERKVDKPIHKSQFFKPLKKKSLLKAVNVLKEALKVYL